MRRARRGAALPGRAPGLTTAAPESAEIERVFRQEYGRAVAVLVRVFGDIDLAEDAVQDAFTVAAVRWPSRTACRPSPAGWIITTARNRPSTACAGRRPASRPAGAGGRAAARRAKQTSEGAAVPDDRLRLIFTCCHPALAPGGPGRADAAAARRALPRRRSPAPSWCPRPTMAQRLVRAKAQDPRRRHPLPGPARGRSARPAAGRPGGHLPRLQRGLHRHLGRRSWSARTCAPRRSGSAGCWPSSCPTSPRSPGCWR